jgi:hypothetical protein
MKVTFGALLGWGPCKIPQMFVVPLLFKHYPLIRAMRPKAHSVLTVCASRSPNEAARA